MRVAEPSADPSLSELEANIVIALSHRFEAVERLTAADLERFEEEKRERFRSVMTKCEIIPDQSKEAPPFLSLPEADFRAHLRTIDNDLVEQVAIVDRGFTIYVQTGEIPAPYFPWRIAVILRKAKREDLEERFLAAWLKHFEGRGGGARYGQLAARFRKLRDKRAMAGRKARPIQ